MKDATIQQIMKIGYADFEKSHPLPLHVRKAAEAIIACRTSRLGGHVQGCPDGCFQRIWYNSCKHRVCPTCASIGIERWLIKQQSRLLDCDHDHAIFTIADKLSDIWLLNTATMPQILFDSVRDTLYSFFDDDHHLGARPGIIASLHTWSQTGMRHPHIHCLITAGGLSPENIWRSDKKGYCLPFRAVMVKFRGKFLAYLNDAIQAGTVKLPIGMSYQKWLNLKNKLGRVKWNVNFRERYSHGNGVLSYLARYIRGGPISDKRILSVEDDHVVFRYRRYEKSGAIKHDTMRLSIEDFIQRYLFHIPAPRSKVVRYYGLYAPNKRRDLELCRQVVGQEPIREPDVLSWQEFCETKGAEHPERCPVCGKSLVCMSVIPAARGMPPPEEIPISEAA